MTRGDAELAVPPEAIDFTDEETTLAPVTFQEKPYNPDRAREGIRGAIALTLLGAIILLSIFPYVVSFSEPTPSPADAVWYELLISSIDRSLTALIGVFAAVTGFYFGSLERTQSRGR